MENQTMDVAVLDEKIKGMRETVAAIEIKNDNDLAKAADAIKFIKTIGKAVREEMEKYTKPAMAIVNQARLKFLPYEKECLSAEAELKSRANKYMTEVEEARAKKEAQIAAAAEAGRFKESTAIRKMEELGEEQKTISTGESKLIRSMVSVAVIVDESLIPDEYWIVDVMKVKKAALAGVEIPGVKVEKQARMGSF